MKKINQGFDCWEEYELAPGLVMTIKREDNSVLKTIDNFVNRRGSISELKKILKGEKDD